jgi:tetratricopeptide (TPR) repeat protein
MRVRSGWMLMLASGLALGGCAASTSTAGGSGAPTAARPAGGATARGGNASSPSANYPPGIRPRDTDLTRRAQVLLIQKNYDQAIALANQGLQADSTNARYYLILGEAQAGAGKYELADQALTNAQRIYPAYGREAAPIREQAWATAFNEGVTAYNASNTDAAIAAWEKANQIYSYRAESSQNLAALYTQKGDYAKAIQAYQAGMAALSSSPPGRELTAEEMKDRAQVRGEMSSNLAELLLFTEKYADAEKLYREQLAKDASNIGLQSKLAAAIAAQPGRGAEAAAMYNTLLASPNLRVEDYQDIGVALFTAKNYPRASEAFAKVSAARPNSREALYNQANALYAGEQWAALLPVAQKLVTLDPLYEDSYLMLARAQREAKQNPDALASLQIIEQMPVKVKDVQLRAAATRTTVRGTAVGNAAAQGSPVQLRFTFYGANGQAVGTQTASISAPAKAASVPFTVTLDSPTAVVGYKYELVR